MKTESFKIYMLKQKIVPYMFLLPNLLIFSIFIIMPALIGVYYSFTDMTLFTFDTPNFIGFENYSNLFNQAAFIDTTFGEAMFNTFKLVIATVPIVFVISLGLAVLLAKGIKFIGFFRATYYWPVMISAIVVGILWQWILREDFGLYNTILEFFGMESVKTLSNELFAWWAVVFAIAWSRSGYYMIIFLAALLSIPTSLYEAAEMDGANRIQKFMYVTYPSLKSARLMVFILLTMEVFKTYPLVVTLTGGGPFGATEYSVQLIFETAFASYQVGFASAMSVVMLLIVTIITGLNFFLSKGGRN